MKNASSELLMNLETEGEECRLKLFATSAQQGLRIVVRQAGVIRFEEIGSLSPEQVFDRLIPINDLHEAEVIIYDTNGRKKLPGNYKRLLPMQFFFSPFSVYIFYAAP